MRGFARPSTRRRPRRHRKLFLDGVEFLGSGAGPAPPGLTLETRLRQVTWCQACVPPSGDDLRPSPSSWGQLRPERRRHPVVTSGMRSRGRLNAAGQNFRELSRPPRRAQVSPTSGRESSPVASDRCAAGDASPNTSTRALRRAARQLRPPNPRRKWLHDGLIFRAFTHVRKHGRESVGVAIFRFAESPNQSCDSSSFLLVVYNIVGTPRGYVKWL